MLLKILGLFALCIHLVGCVPPLYMPTATERVSLNTGEKTLVLLRIQCTVDGKPYEPFISHTFTDGPVVIFGLGAFETVGEPRFVVHRFLSEESRRAGWTYFFLSSGVYYLAVLGPDSSPTSKGGGNYFHEAPRWRVDIPENAKLIYVGTLQITGKNAGALLFGGKIIKPTNSDELTLKNEYELASRLLTEHFPDAGETKTILMQRWRQGDPIIIRSPRQGSRK